MKTKLNFKQSITAALYAAGAATIVNVILFFIFHASGTISDSVFVQPNQPMTVVPVIFSSILPSIVAGIVFFLFERFTNNGFKIYTIVSLLLMVLSFAMPFNISGIPLGYAVVLCLMHIVVPVSLLYFIKRAITKLNG